MSAAFETASTPRHVGVYRIDEKIGSGAMGTVYRATHTTLGKKVALKLVRADDPEAELCQRFLLEGIAASRVRHPNVVEVLDAGIDGTNAYLAMQLLEGETLAECLQRQGRLPVTTAIDLILPVCAAMKAAHEAGVLHRDLKPANIFLADVGRGEPEPMLLDFGISKILGPVDAALTQNPRFLGTPLYIAPEQADGAPGSARSDQYALALSLYETLLGVRPFEQHKASLVSLLRHVAEGDIKPACDLDASIPVDLSDVISKAVATDPEHRYPSMQELGAALLPFASEARRTLWQHAFVDAERTMASANAPVVKTPAGRQVSVSVESGMAGARTSETWLEDDSRDGFISHSKLFGENDQEAAPPQESPAERSTISRRFSMPSVPKLGADERPPETTESAMDAPASTVLFERASHADRNSVGVLRSLPASARTRSNNRLVWALSAMLALITVVSTAILLRHEMRVEADHYSVRLDVTPSAATIELDGQQVGSGTFVGSFPRNGASHRLRFEHPGYAPLSVVFQDSPPPKQVRLRPSRESDPTEEVRFVAEAKTKPPKKRANKKADSDSSEQAKPIQQKSSRSAPAAQGTPSPPPPAMDGPAPPPPSPANELASESTSASKSTSASEADPAQPQANQEPATLQPPADPTPPPPRKQKGDKPRSIQTGNLDPWAK